MSNKEYSTIYVIPANYTDSGKLLGGMLETRNAIEAILLVLLLGYPQLMWISMSATTTIIVMTVTLLPLGVLALMGIAGDSLFQYFGHMVRHFICRRKIHLRRIGYRYDNTKQTSTKTQPQKKT